MITPKEQLKQYRNTLDTLSEFDMGPVADIMFRIGNIIGPTHEKILSDFLRSDKVYEPDAPRKMLISVIDSFLAAESN